MARTRLELHRILCDILGSTNCYFDPPTKMEMKYPCFRYNLSRIDTRHADNKNYLNFKGYSVTYITEDPDDEMPDRFLRSDISCRMDRTYVADGLYHYVFMVYF